MPNILHWKQANDNIGFTQGGSQSANQDAVVFGAFSGKPVRILWENARTSIGLGSGAHLGFFDHFLGNVGATSIIAPYSEDAGSTGTILPEGATGDASGTLELTTAAAAANDHITLALGTHWQVGAGESGWVFFETAVQLDQIADTVLEVGLSDALSESAGLAFSDHSVGGVTDVATDAAVLVFDSAVGANWLANAVNSGTPAAVDTGLVAAIDTWYAIRIEVAPSGNAFFYVNGTLAAEIEDAVAVDALLGPWLSLVTLGTSAAVASVDYLGVLGDNPAYAE